MKHALINFQKLTKHDKFLGGKSDSRSDRNEDRFSTFTIGCVAKNPPHHTHAMTPDSLPSFEELIYNSVWCEDTASLQFTPES